MGDRSLNSIKRAHRSLGSSDVESELKQGEHGICKGDAIGVNMVIYRELGLISTDVNQFLTTNGGNYKDIEKTRNKQIYNRGGLF